MNRGGRDYTVCTCLFQVGWRIWQPGLSTDTVRIIWRRKFGVPL